MKKFLRPFTLVKIISTIIIAIIVLVIVSSSDNLISISSPAEQGSVPVLILESGNAVFLATKRPLAGHGDNKGDKSNGKWQELFKNPVYSRRLSQAMDTCFKRYPMGFAQRIMTDKRKTSAFCIIPKVGCTHWINIFRFINNETHGVVYNRPSDIPRWITHYGNVSRDFSLTKTQNTPSYLQETSFVGDSFRFMFVRDPYRRLWSAWVDTFLLPDFWFSEGPFVGQLLKLDVQTSMCPTNITFVQFLRFVTHGYFAKNPLRTNPHWAPYHIVCDPCVFRPHLIGKMETFETDSRLALSIMNQSNIDENSSGSELRFFPRDNSGKQEDSRFTTDDRAIHEMQMLTAYHFDALVNDERVKVELKGHRNNSGIRVE